MEIEVASTQKEIQYYIKQQLALIVQKITFDDHSVQCIYHPDESVESLDFCIELDIYSSKNTADELLFKYKQSLKTIQSSISGVLGIFGYSVETLDISINDICDQIEDFSQKKSLVIEKSCTYKLDSKSLKKLLKDVKAKIALMKFKPQYMQNVTITEKTKTLSNKTTFDIRNANFADLYFQSFECNIESLVAKNFAHLIYGQEYPFNPTLNLSYQTNFEEHIQKTRITPSIKGTIIFNCTEYLLNIDCIQSPPILQIYDENGIEVTNDLALTEYVCGKNICKLEPSILDDSKAHIRSILNRKLAKNCKVHELKIYSFNKKIKFSNFAKFNEIILIINIPNSQHSDYMMFKFKKNEFVVTDLENNVLKNELGSKIIDHLSANWSDLSTELFSSNRAYSNHILKTLYQKLYPFDTAIYQIYFC